MKILYTLMVISYFIIGLFMTIRGLYKIDHDLIFKGLVIFGLAWIFDYEE